MKEVNTYAIRYEILRAAHEDELIESGELVLQGEDILDVVLQVEDALLDPQEREECKVKVLSINKA